MIQDIFIQSSHEGKEGLCNPPHPPLPLHISGAHHSITQALRGLISPQAPHCSNQEDGMPISSPEFLQLFVSGWSSHTLLRNLARFPRILTSVSILIVHVLLCEEPIKLEIEIHCPRVYPGDQPLTKSRRNSGLEIDGMPDGMPDGMHSLPTLGRQLSKQLRINIELTRRSIYSREIIEETKKINPLICLTSLDFQYCCVSCVARSTILEKPS